MSSEDKEAELGLLFTRIQNEPKSTCFFMPVRVMLNFLARRVIEASARPSCSRTPRRVGGTSQSMPPLPEVRVGRVCRSAARARPSPW